MIRRHCAFVIFLLCACLLRAQSSGELGKVSFPISCAPATRAEFERGVALMHSFQYPGAQPVFAGIAKKDPQCAMAAWGEAMDLYHQLWNFPDAEALRKGHELIRPALSASGITERERMYIAAAAAFFDDSPSVTNSQRVKNYTAKMAELWRRNPQDVEAGSLYALALLSWLQEDTEKSRKEAISLLQDLFARAPDHPGVDHYLIHATDTSEFATQGLKAAQQYALTAPASSHALHMPSHIFAQLGMWKEMADSNLAAAAAAADDARKDKNNGASYQLHPMHYLRYAYLQMGRDAETLKLIDSLKDVPNIDPDEVTDEGSAMKALFLMETHRWDLASQFDRNSATVPFVRVRVHWASAIAAARLGDRKTARREVKKLRRAIAAMKKGKRSDGSTASMALEAEAWLEFVSGKPDAAVRKMREAADADPFGVDQFSLPAREQLGDLLLELKRPAEALEAYEAALKKAPGRFNSLWGAGRAAELANRPGLTRQYYGELVKNADPASDRPELRQAREWLGRQGRTSSESATLKI